MKNTFVLNTLTNEKVYKPQPLDEETLYDGGAMITETDTKGIITFANRKFIDMTGYSRKELLGSPHNINRHPDMPRVAFEGMWKSIKEGEMWQGLVKNLCKNGKYYWVDVWVQAKHDAEGNHIGYIAGRKVPFLEDIKHARKKYKQLLIDEKNSVNEQDSIIETLSMDEFLDILQKEKKRIFACVAYVKKLTHIVDSSVQSDVFGEEGLFCKTISNDISRVEALEVNTKLIQDIEHDYKLIFNLYKQIEQIYATKDEVTNSNKIEAKTHFTNLTKNTKILLDRLNALELACLSSMFN